PLLARGSRPLTPPDTAFPGGRRRRCPPAPPLSHTMLPPRPCGFDFADVFPARTERSHIPRQPPAGTTAPPARRRGERLARPASTCPAGRRPGGNLSARAVPVPAPAPLFPPLDFRIPPALPWHSGRPRPSASSSSRRST